MPCPSYSWLGTSPLEIDLTNVTESVADISIIDYIHSSFSIQSTHDESGLAEKEARDAGLRMSRYKTWRIVPSFVVDSRFSPDFCFCFPNFDATAHDLESIVMCSSL